MKLALSAILAVSLVASFGATEVRAHGYVHQQNLRVVQEASVLASQAAWIASQAAYYVGPSVDYNDRQALQELRIFAQFTQTVYQRAYQLVCSPNDPVMVHRQLEQLFYNTWTGVSRVEAFLYRSYRLQPLRGFWAVQMGGTLRQLRATLYGHGRDARRDANFARLFPN